MVHYIFDGSFEGLLTAVFDMYELRHNHIILEREGASQPKMLSEEHHVHTSGHKADRVWKALQKKLSVKGRNAFLYAYLSEDTTVHTHCLLYARHIFDNPSGAEQDFTNASVLALSQAEKMVSRERHRMKAFTRFIRTSDGIYYAPIEPDFNVLPLIADFFKNRFADQQWIIYDTRRRYGLHYNLKTVSEIVYEQSPLLSHYNLAENRSLLDPSEELSTLLWKDYFRSTNIAARKNIKLHVRHVPRRYWKYLTEKQL